MNLAAEKKLRNAQKYAVVVKLILQFFFFFDLEIFLMYFDGSEFFSFLVEFQDKRFAVLVLLK